MSHENFDPLTESRARADVGRQVFEQFMERDNTAQSVAEHSQGHADFAGYLETRPYEDKNGKLHNPDTNAFMSKSDAQAVYSNPDTQVEVESFSDFYKSMENFSLSELALLSAGYLHQGDKTVSGDLDYIIRNKIENTGSKTDLENRDGSTRDKSEADKLYDRVMKLRDSKLEEMNARKEENDSRQKQLDDEYNEVVEAAVLSMGVNVEESLIPAPPSLKEVLENTTVRQAKLLNHAWEKQTGQYKDPVDPNEVEEVEEVVAPIVVPVVVDAEEENDLPPIIESDDESLNPVPVIVENETIEVEKKKKWPRRVAIGAIALAGILGAALIANRIADDDGNSGEAPAATAPAPDSGVEFGVTTTSLETPTATDELPDTTDAPAETDAEAAQAEAVAAVVANYTPEQQAQMSGDASAVVVAGDVMPSTNVSSANVANQRVTMQAALDTYNLTHSTNFQFGEGDMFWNGDHVMNPDELGNAEDGYNRILQQLIEEASK